MVILFWNGALQLYMGSHFLSTVKMLAGSGDISILNPLPIQIYLGLSGFCIGGKMYTKGLRCRTV